METKEQKEQKYKDYLALEETVLKDLGLWTDPAAEDDAKTVWLFAIYVFMCLFTCLFQHKTDR